MTPRALWGSHKVDREGQKPRMESHKVDSSYMGMEHKVERAAGSADTYSVARMRQRGWEVRQWGDDEVTLVRGATSPLACPSFATRRSQD